MKNNIAYPCKAANKMLVFDKPLIMGVLNTTPDSFYGGSRVSEQEAVDYAGRMIEHGVDIIDIGGMSSRPGAEEIPVTQEVNRLTPAIEAIRDQFPEIIISVDTYRTEVVKAADDIGIDIVNDISAGTKDPDMFRIVAELNLMYVMMHMKGSPKTMQNDTDYNDIILDIMTYMSQAIAKAKKFGLHDIIIDPGIGFGKSIDDNYKIIKRLSSFKIFDLPILLGLSRKSFIYKVLELGPDEALGGTIAMNMLGLLNGAKILRVHDTKEAVELNKLFQRYDSV